MANGLADLTHSGDIQTALSGFVFADERLRLAQALSRPSE